MELKKALYWGVLEIIGAFFIVAACSGQGVTFGGTPHDADYGAVSVYNQPGKLFGVRCNKNLLKDKCFWVTTATVAASSIVAGFAESHAKAGGTNLFGASGTSTSNGEIAGVFAVGTAVITGLEVADHKILYSSVPLGKFWNCLAYVGPAWGYEGPVLYQASGNWSSSPAPKVDMSKVQTVRRP